MASRLGERLSVALADAGLGVRDVADTWKRLLSAKRQVPIITRGEVTDVWETDDWAAQATAAHRLTEIFGGYPAKRLAIDSTVRVEQLHELALRLDALPIDQRIEIAEHEPLAIEGDAEVIS